MTPRQCRAGRSLLGWTQGYLSLRSEISDHAIRNFETNQAVPKPDTVDKLRAALEQGGVVFLTEPLEGVALR